jgi:glucoamylase
MTVTAQLDPAAQAGPQGQDGGQPRPLVYARVQTALPQSSLTAIAQHMFSLMLRNMSSDGFVFADPEAGQQAFSPGTFSVPGCIIAAPSFPADLGTVDQDYVFNWTRDAAVTAVEIAASNMPTRPGEGVQPLIDYVNFAQTCQNNSGSVTIGHATYTVEGQPQPRTEQSDGPALQTLAILQALPQLDVPTQATAASVINTNINYLLGADPQAGVPVYQSETTNLWEEEKGFSFFARSVQLKCFQQLTANTYGIPVPPATAGAITWLQNALAGHWNGQYYRSILPVPADRGAYDPNIDIVLSSTYGAVPVTDTKLLATAAQIRQQWSDSPIAYPINGTDQKLSSGPVGPLLGRYPGDTYDGDLQDPQVAGHPWALCTANFAGLYYALANTITQTQTVPLDNLSASFFGQVGVGPQTTPAAVASALQSAGDQMLNALVFHSDHLELSEQFDKVTGFEKSVRDLSWSYASFLAAVRAKTGQSVLG